MDGRGLADGIASAFIAMLVIGVIGGIAVWELVMYLIRHIDVTVQWVS